ncbi:Response regulator receiver domain-containing protein [Paracidovorax cattleyae]|uniref:Response regulator receiver domain-containing protein n=1 Tax=Paracidovorax cattleyae TaxID=80868 RepID=A0A1H0W9T8_9BURK|nr:response regulator [Paracidovorax cattleyae]SDP87165.1 Response regulator receiver domain-containing protein [Paracidovorax cattleyae]
MIQSPAPAPATDSLRPSTPEPFPGTDHSMTPLRILYVEDNAELRETIGMLLEGDDREVVSCATAEEALKLDGPQPFDIVVTDVSLPGMSGTDLCRKLLQVDSQRWIVLCSGYQFGHGLDTLGPNVRALLKPFELEDLEALMESIRSALRPGTA